MKMNNIDKQYQSLLQDILDNGYTKKDRTGTGTISVYGRTIRHKMSDGFPLLTTKKMYFKGIVTELLWFLRGDTNIQYLLDNDCHIWDGDAYKNFVKILEKNLPDDYPRAVLTKDEFIKEFKFNDYFAEKWGDLGPIYGKQWRHWGSFKDRFQFTDNGRGIPIPVNTSWDGIDQIANSINLLKTDPDSRRNIVSAWNVGEIDSMVLPPCHMFFQFYTRELTFEERWELAKVSDIIEKEATIPTPDETYLGLNQRNEIISLWDDPVLKLDLPKRAISLMWYQRSVDTPLGLPFNIASYALLLEIVARMVNMVPDELIGTLGDTHIYLNQVDGVKEQLTKEPYQLPTLKMGKTNAFYKSLSDDLSLLGHLDPSDFTIENYQSHPTIKYPLSN